MKVKKLKVKNTMIAILTAGIALGLTGCGKKSDCEIAKYHLHRYEKEGIISYLPNEELSYRGFNWTNEVIYKEKEEKELQKFKMKNGLLSISENKDYIKNLQEKNHDFMEYRYAYTYMHRIPHVIRVGKITTIHFTSIPVTHYSWTTNPNHSRLTGEVRLCHHVYEACRIEKDEKGKYIIVKSPKVDDVFTIQKEYPYFTEKFTKIVESKNRKELDYENMIEDDNNYILSEKEAQKYEMEEENTKSRR